MKRTVGILLILLLLSGCSLRNHQSSEDFFPTGTQQTLFPPEWTQGPGQEDPLQPQEKALVRCIQSFEGELPKSSPPRQYSYQLPMIDLWGAQATACNQEIENRFEPLIRQSLEAIRKYEVPVLERLSYSSFLRGDILTLRIDRLDSDGVTGVAYYTVNAETGEAVSVQALFAAAGVEGDPEKVVNEAAIALFTRRFGSPEGAETEVTTALNRTQAGLLPLSANRMHLTENGRLKLMLELFDPKGDSTIEELELP